MCDGSVLYAAVRGFVEAIKQIHFYSPEKQDVRKRKKEQQFEWAVYKFPDVPCTA